jgi:hypothetical protein
MQAFHCGTLFSSRIEICGRLTGFFPQVLLVLTHTNQHSTFFSCQFGMSHFTWHVAGLELRKDIAQHTGEEFLETVSLDAANFLNCVQNCTFFDKQ